MWNRICVRLELAGRLWNVMGYESVEPQGLKSLREPRSSPEGTPELSPGRQSWVDVSDTTSPEGTAEHAGRGFSRP